MGVKGVESSSSVQPPANKPVQAQPKKVEEPRKDESDDRAKAAKAEESKASSRDSDVGQNLNVSA